MISPTSTRLSSPPPIPEDQLSPVPASPGQQKFFSNLDHAAARRIRPGTKAADMAIGPPLVDLSEIDSAFQLTEHLKALHNFLTHPVGSDGTISVDKEMAIKLAQSPDNVDRTLWLYELCRFLTQKVNSIIVALFSDTPPCSSTTCPEMRASEWQYLCAVHDPPKSCCAIDYCCHTLDWAANTLTSPKHFPSRLALGADQSTQHSQMRQLTNIFRRVYRIFAHAWFQHREMFWKVEGRTGLYIFFKTVCDVYGLIPEDNYTIPAEAEGGEPSSESKPSTRPLILKREPSEASLDDDRRSSMVERVADNTLSTSATTKRHRHSPSVGATPIHSVVEESEEEEDQSKPSSRPLSQIFDTDSDVTVMEDLSATKEEAGHTKAAARTIADSVESVDQVAEADASTEMSMDAIRKEDETETAGSSKAFESADAAENGASNGDSSGILPPGSEGMEVEQDEDSTSQEATKSSEVKGEAN